MENSDTRSYQWKEHIRMRPAMYIGSVRNSGFTQLLEYLFEELLEYKLANPVFEMGFYPDNRIRIQIKGISTKEIALWIYEIDETPKPPFYLGLPVLIALSSEASITVHHLPSVIVLSAKQSNYQWAASSSEEKENSITFDFTPDPEIFKELKLVYEQTNPFLQQFAYLNAGLKIISEEHSVSEFQRNIFHYPNGIFDQLDLYLSQRHYWHSPVLRLNVETSLNDYDYRIAIHGPDSWHKKARQKTFAGNTETYSGGSLENGIVEGLILVIKSLAKKEEVKVCVTKNEIKKYFTFIAAINGEQYSYEGSTKWKLGMPQIKKDAMQIVYEEMMAYYQLKPNDITMILRDFRTWEEDEDA